MFNQTLIRLLINEHNKWPLFIYFLIKYKKSHLKNINFDKITNF